MVCSFSFLIPLLPILSTVDNHTNNFSTIKVPLDQDSQRAFVAEIERSRYDPVYWVRREATFALGALAKVVPEELVFLSLVRDNLALDIFADFFSRNESTDYSYLCLTLSQMTRHGMSDSLSCFPYLLSLVGCPHKRSAS